MPPWIPIVGLGALAAWVVRGLVADRSTRAAQADDPGIWSWLEGELAATVADWRDRVLDVTLQFESGGRYDALNRNTDGAGLSWGIIQWAQRPGSLGELLQGMYDTDPEHFAETFGGQAAARSLLDATHGEGIRAADGADLWREPWVSRFRAAGRDPVWQRYQRERATRGPYMAAAQAAARTMDLHSERALALLFDRSVQQGTGRVGQVASEVAALELATERARLEEFGRRMVARAPSTWRADVQRRVDRVLADTSISDGRIA